MGHNRLDELNQHVNEAIHFAETAANQTSVETREAYLKVSRLEAEIAELLPASSPEGAIARRGAVRSALKAGQSRRALALVAIYLHEGVDERLERELRAFISQ